MNVRRKPRSSVTDNCNPASDETYLLLAQIATEAVINRQVDVVLKLPYFCRFSEGFPKGVCTRFDDNYDLYRMKAERLINWLYDKGYTNNKYADIIKATKQLTYLERRIERMLSEEVVEDNSEEIVEETEEDIGE